MNESPHSKEMRQPHVKLSFTYDDAGNRLSMSTTYDDSKPSNERLPMDTYYTYDSAGRLGSLNFNSDYMTSFEYDGMGRRAVMRRPFGHKTAYNYNGEGLLQSMYNYIDGGSEINRFTYSYDAAGRRTVMSTLDYDVAYGYDNLDRLGSSIYSSFGKPGSSGAITSANLPDENFSYDVNGNRQAGPLASQTYGYSQPSDGDASPLNRLATDGTWNYLYDHNGNVTRKTSVSNPNEMWQYFYNYKGNMNAVRYFDTAGNLVMESNYLYDPLGRRFFKGVKTGADAVTSNFTNIYKYVYDGDDVIMDYYRDSAYSAGEPDRLRSRYVHGPGVDEPLIWFTSAGQGGEWKRSFCLYRARYK